MQAGKLRTRIETRCQTVCLFYLALLIEGSSRIEFER